MDDKLLSPEHLTKMINKAKKEWVPFAFGFGGETPRLVMHPTKEGKALFTMLKSATDIRKGGWGVCMTAGKVLTLNFEKELSGAKAKGRVWIKEADAGLSKVVILVQGVAFVDPEDEEDVEAHASLRGEAEHDHGHVEESSYSVDRDEDYLLENDPELWDKWRAQYTETVKLFDPVLKKYPHRRKEILREVAFAKQCFEDKDLEALRVQWAKLREIAKDLGKHEEKGAEIEQKIPDYTSSDSDDISREYLANMPKEEIRNLPTRTKILMLKSLQDGNYSEEDKAAVKKLFSVNYLDPKFEQEDEKKRKELLLKLDASPELKQAKKKWTDKDMTNAERLEVLQQAADLMSEAYGMPKVAVEFYDQPPEEDGTKENGFYSHCDGKLHINTNSSNDYHRGLHNALATVVHENAHRYQNLLVDQLDNGEIQEGDAEYEQAWLFKLNQPPNHYIKSNIIEYYTQPLETHSRVSGAEIERMVKSW